MLGHSWRRRCRAKRRDRRSGSLGRLFPIVLSIALALLISAPAFAESASENQYESAALDQYQPFTGIGGEAANTALKASKAFSSGPGSAVVPPSVSEPTENPTPDNKGGPRLTELPETGGVSPIWLGFVLVAGGLLVRGVARRDRDR